MYVLCVAIFTCRSVAKMRRYFCFDMTIHLSSFFPLPTPTSFLLLPFFLIDQAGPRMDRFWLGAMGEGRRLKCGLPSTLKATALGHPDTDQDRTIGWLRKLLASDSVFSF